MCGSRGGGAGSTTPGGQYIFKGDGKDVWFLRWALYIQSLRGVWVCLARAWLLL